MSELAPSRYAGMLARVLRLVQVFLGFWLVVLAGFAVYYFPTGFIRGFENLWVMAMGQVDISAAAIGWQPVANAPHLADTVYGFIAIPLKTASPTLVFLWFFGAAIPLVIWMVIAGTVRAIVLTIHRAVPFEQENVTRIQCIGYLLIASTFLDSIVMLISGWWLKHHPLYEGMKVRFFADFSWTSLIAGLVMLLLADVFRRGLALQQDQDLTI